MRLPVIPVLIVSLVASTRAAADLVEMLNGQRLEGEVMGTTPKEVLLKMTMGGRSVQMKFRIEKVHAITVGGVRKVVNEKSGSTRPTRTTTAGSTGAKGTGGTDPDPDAEEPKVVLAGPTDEGKGEEEEPEVSGSGKARTKSAVMALIDKAGKARPDWWDDEPLNYPQTLNLTWEPPPKGQWIPQKYLGQYIISVGNPNPGRWQGAAKLLHHTLELNKQDRAKLATSMERMGHVYGNLLGDHARGAFWWQMAAKYGANINWLGLASCYWKLGCKPMATSLLGRMGSDRTGHGGVIKLWSDVGELRKALLVAEEKARSHFPDSAYRAAGDACRAHGRLKEALAFYQKVFEVPSAGKRAKGIDKNKQRARENIDAIRVFEALNLATIPDGDYTGSGTGYRGPVQVRVSVQKGRIESVKITQHKEDWFYTSFTELPRQIVEKQGLKGVDAVTGATMTSEAIINGSAKALASAMK